MTDERDRLTDPKLIFYLERRQQIDEWAKLPNLEKAAAAEFLRSVMSDVFEMARVLEPEISVDNLTLESEELIALWRPSWLSTEETNEALLPRVMIAIGWWKSVRFELAGSGPFVGLRVRSNQPALRRSIGQLVSDSAIGKQAFPAGNPVGSSGWVRYRNVPVTGERFWEDLGPYRAALIHAVHEAWQEFAEVVQQVLRPEE